MFIYSALEAGVWAETATEGGRRFMAAWKKKRTTQPDTVGILHRKRKICEATPIGLITVEKSKYSTPVPAREGPSPV